MIFRVLVLALGLIVPAFAASTPAVRIAVVSDASEKDLAALVETEISSGPSIALVERDDLSKIGDEAKVRQMAGGDATALGKLLGADGLLFLEKQGEGLHVRLTAVRLGYSVFDFQAPAGFEPGELAKSLGHRVGQASPKLTLENNQALPVSILNLRSDLTTAQSAKVERDLTLLLESRLASIPECVVLERRHAWDLAFDHSIDPGSHLLEGACVLNGTLRIGGDNGSALTAQIRLRDSKSKRETSITIPGRADDLPGLADALAGQIAKAIGASLAESSAASQTEARDYLREGIWAWEHGQARAAVEALDSAELLGETAPDLLAARIQALCQMVVPDLNPAEIEIMGDPGAMLTVFQHANSTRYYSPLQPLADRLILARRALADFAAYAAPSALDSYHLQLLDPKWQHAVQLSYTRQLVIFAASSILAELDRENNPETTPFREEVRQAAGFDPLNGKMPPNGGDAAFFADEWAHSLEEETAYYRQVLTAPGTQNQFAAAFLKERFINERGLIFCPRFIPDPAEQQKGFVAFAESLEDSPAGKLSGLLILSNDADRSLAEASYAAFLDELGNQRAGLVPGGELAAHCLAAYDVHQRANAIQVKTGGHALPILRYYLTHSSAWPARTLDVLWLPASFPRADAPAIWKEFKGYKARVLDPKSSTGQYAFQEEAIFGAYESAYSHVFPDPADAPENPLEVTRFWQPCTTAGVPFFGIQRWAAQGGSVVVAGMNPGQIEKLYVLHPPYFTGDPLPMPDGAFPFEMALTSKEIYITGFTKEGKDAAGGLVFHWRLYRYELAARTWGEHDIPLEFAAPRIVDGQLFLTISSGNGQHGAIARYDWATQTIALLSSDRRRPAQNQFDDRTGYQVLSLFPGLNHTIGTNIDFKCFTVGETPGNWPEIVPGFNAERAVPLGEKTLLEDYRTKTCLLVDPPANRLETLLAPPGQTLSAEVSIPGPVRWTPDGTTILKLLDAEKGLHGNALFGLVRHLTAPAHFELCWLDGARREPVHIPLHFQMDAASQAAVTHVAGQAANTVSATNPDLDPFPLQMIAVDSGVCLYHPSAGIWFIPYSDIEAWLKAAPQSP